MPEVAVVATFLAKPGQEENLKDALQTLCAATHKEAGVLQYDLHRDVKEPRRFVFFERWKSAEALAEHNEMPHIATFRAVAPDLIEHGEVNVVSKI